MATTREYPGRTCTECGELLYSDVMEIGNAVSSPRYRVDGPTCWTTGCKLDLERRLAPGYTTYR